MNTIEAMLIRLTETSLASCCRDSFAGMIFLITFTSSESAQLSGRTPELFINATGYVCRLIAALPPIFHNTHAPGKAAIASTITHNAAMAAAASASPPKYTANPT